MGPLSESAWIQLPHLMRWAPPFWQYFIQFVRLLLNILVRSHVIQPPTKVSVFVFLVFGQNGVSYSCDKRDLESGLGSSPAHPRGAMWSNERQDGGPHFGQLSAYFLGAHLTMTVCVFKLDDVSGNGYPSI